ncbi:MAG: tetratricopeptide repeat-containing sulfotransferase family protein [Rhizomicrobium sp.]
MGEQRSATGPDRSVWTLSARLDPAAPAQPEICPVFPDIRRRKQLLATDAPAAEAQARAWLVQHPADSDAAYGLGAALRRQGRSAEALAVFEALTASQPQMSQAWRELGLAHADLGERHSAFEALRQAIDLDWFDREAWLALGEAAEPSDADARVRFQSVARLFAQGSYSAALPELEGLLAADPGNGFLRALKGLALAWSRKFDEGVEELARVTREADCGPGVWLEYGRLLRATGDDRAAHAFAAAIARLPSFSEAYVALANSKSIRIDESLIERIRAQLAPGGLPADDRARLNYVLGRALEDLGDYADSFAAYRASNEILKRIRGSGVEHSDLYLRDAKAFFTKEFFITRGAAGADAESPIFIVGMPRSGSTLVEQILSSHPQVEALGEIANLTETGQRLAPGRPDDPQGGYPRVLQYLDGAGFRRMGEEYVRSTLSRRRTDRPYFTDKLPGNYCHVGMIHLALPNARIIDVRRHPLDCCLSCYKHYFPAGHLHALDLADIGGFYANYVELMAHFDEVLPDRVYRIIYEDLVENPDAEVRRMLDHIGIPFDEACLRFYENRRPVLTFSADQVRQPLFGSGIGRWRQYDAYLEPLRRALGDVLDVYPGVPAFASTHAATAPVKEDPAPRASFVTGLRRISFETAPRFTGTPAASGKPPR